MNEEKQQTTSQDENWFVIMCSWELGADDEAVKRFNKLYEYLDVLRDTEWLKAAQGSKDLRLDLNSESILALNLIGRRKFLIICQARSNRVMQELSKMISLRAPIKVEIFPATNVHDLYNILKPEKQNQ